MVVTTTTAATQAGVTTATIRTWCRRGAVAATKTAGRWIIDTASLAHRIAIGAMRTRKQTKPMAVTGTLTQLRNGSYGVRGNADALAAAYANGTPIAPTNDPYTSDRVYLGTARETYGDYGITLKSRGLAYAKDGGEAVYHLDTSRLEEAPTFAAALNEARRQQEEADAAMYAQDEDYLNPRYM